MRINGTDPWPENHSQRSSSLATIFNLPNELLLEVFAYCAAHRPDPPSSAPPWIGFSQVCQRWRSIALSAPTLWSEPDLRIPDMGELMLKRSQNAPLDIVWSHEYNQTSYFLSKALDHIHRIATLAITQDIWRVILPPVSDDLTNPAPLLTSLKLSSVGRGGTTLPHNFLGNHTPKLTKLVISGPISMVTPLLKNNLTALTIDYRNYNIEVGYKFFIDFLRHLGPRLKHLTLVNAFPNVFELPFERNLLNLRPDFRLALEEIDIVLLRHLLDNMTFPSPPHFDLIIGTLPIDSFVAQGEISQLYACIGRCYDARNNPYLFTYLEVGVFGLFAYASGNGEVCEESDCPGCAICKVGHSDLEVSYKFKSITTPTPTPTPLPLLDEDSWAVLPFKGVRTLEFIYDAIGDRRLSPPWRMEYFFLLPRLTRVAVEGSWFAEQFMRCFISIVSTADNVESQKDTIAFPTLRTLIMRDVDFDTPLFEAFVAGLKFRSGYGAPVQKLVLDGCDGLSDDNVGLIRELVRDVIVKDWE